MLSFILLYCTLSICLFAIYKILDIYTSAYILKKKLFSIIVDKLCDDHYKTVVYESSYQLNIMSDLICTPHFIRLSRSVADGVYVLYKYYLVGLSLKYDWLSEAFVFDRNTYIKETYKAYKIGAYDSTDNILWVGYITALGFKCKLARYYNSLDGYHYDMIHITKQPNGEPNDIVLPISRLYKKRSKEELRDMIENIKNSEDVEYR